MPQELLFELSGPRVTPHVAAFWRHPLSASGRENTMTFCSIIAAGDNFGRPSNREDRRAQGTTTLVHSCT